MLHKFYKRFACDTIHWSIYLFRLYTFEPAFTWNLSPCIAPRSSLFGRQYFSFRLLFGLFKLGADRLICERIYLKQVGVNYGLSIWISFLSIVINFISRFRWWWFIPVTSLSRL